MKYSDLPVGQQFDTIAPYTPHYDTHNRRYTKVSAAFYRDALVTYRIDNPSRNIHPVEPRLTDPDEYEYA